MGFEEWCRKYDINFDEIKGTPTEAKLRAIYAESTRGVPSAGGKDDEKGAKIDPVEAFNARRSIVMNTVQAMTDGADPRIVADMNRAAMDIVADDSVSLKDAPVSLRAKLGILTAGMAAKGDEQTSPDQAVGTRHIVTSVRTQGEPMRKQDIVDAFTGENSRSLRLEAGKGVLDCMRNHDKDTVEAIMSEVSKSEGKIRVWDEDRKQVREVTSTSQNLVLQSVNMAILNAGISSQVDKSAALVRVVPSTSKEETFPEISAESTVEPVPEGGTYPIMSGSDRDVKLGHNKWGCALVNTRESSIFDRIGYFDTLLTDASQQVVGYRANQRYARIASSTALDGKHVNFPGSSDGLVNLYSATPDAYRGNINQQVNPLVDTASITKARTLLWGQVRKDGDPVDIDMRILLVRPDQYDLAWKLVNAIYDVDSGATAQTAIPNIFGAAGAPDVVRPVVVSDVRLNKFTAAGEWFAGDFQRQFYEREIWAPEVMPKINGGDALRDIQSVWIVSACSEVCSLSNMMVAKNTAT